MSYQMTHPHDIRLSGKRASRYSSRMVDLGRNDVLVTRGIYHDMRYSTIEYNRHIGTRRSYRPTIVW